jgi:putative Holliday junction resolvase
MDSVDYDFPKEGGTRVKMSKCLTCEKGRVLGVDHGEKRIGLALSDELCIIARPFGVIETGRIKDALGEICSVAASNQVGEIVVGLPINLRGESTPSTERARAFATDLAGRSGLRVVTWDERLSTRQGERALIESGMRRQKRKRKVDAVAAAIVLQSYLDSVKEQCQGGK